MATTSVQNISLANTFAEWVVVTNDIVNISNALVATDFIKSTGTVYLEDPVLGISVSNNALFQGSVDIGGGSGSLLVRNDAEIQGALLLSNLDNKTPVLIANGTANITTVYVSNTLTSNALTSNIITVTTLNNDYVNSSFYQANTAASTANGAFVRANSVYDYANTGYLQANNAASFANGAFVAANSAASFANSAFVKANASFGQANNSFNVANAAFNQANNSFNVANAAFNQANNSFNVANLVYNTANSASSFANGAFVRANSVYDYANTGYLQANNAASFANGSFVTANSAASFANSAFVTANSSASFANGSFTKANAAFNQANNSFNVANAAFNQANNSFNVANVIYNAANSAASFANGAFVAANNAASFANGAFVSANSAASFANSAFVTANSAASFANASFTKANSAGSFANGAFISANSAASFANSAYAWANAAYDAANTASTSTGAFARANSAYNQANSAYAWANSAYDYANTISISSTKPAFDRANSAYDQANSAASFANSAFALANTIQASSQSSLVFDRANSAYAQANLAFDRANTKFNSTGGTISGDTTITGNLIVNGVTTSINTTTVATTDSLIELAQNNTVGDTLDIGFYGAYQLGGATRFTGLVRKASDKYYLLQGATTDPVSNTINWNNFPTVPQRSTLDGNFTGGTVSGLSSAISVSDGGTGVQTIPTGQIIIGAGTSAITTLANTVASYGSANGLYIPIISTDVYGRATITGNVAIDASSSGFTISAFNRANSAYNFANSAIFSITANTSGGLIANGTTGSSRTGNVLLSLATYGTATTSASNGTYIPIISTDIYGRTTITGNVAVVGAGGGGGSTFYTLTANSGQLIANGVNSAVTGNIQLGLATSGATAGYYGSATQNPVIQVDTYGRIVSVANVTSSGGSATQIQANTGLTANGTTGVSQTGTVLLGLSTTGVTAGYYGSASIIPVIQVGTDGRVVSLSNVASSSAATYIQANTNSGLFANGRQGVSTTGTVLLSLANTAVAAGTYGGASQQTIITVDGSGRITYAANVASSGGASSSIQANTNSGLFANGTQGTTQTGTVLLSLANTSVATGTYGGSTQIPVITVDGSGRATYAANVAFTGGTSVSVTDDTTTNITEYLLSARATSGTVSTVYTASTDLYFNPSTGTLNATIFNSLSDVSLKENVQQVSSALDTVDQLKGVSFDWKQSGNKSYGVIAQDVEQVLPDVVSTNNDGVKSVNYHALTAFLIESIKELRKEINELKGK